MKFLCLLIFIANTLALDDYESENEGSDESWWVLESILERELREFEFAELIVSTVAVPLDEADLEIINRRSESLLPKFRDLASKSGMIAEKIQMLANLLSVHSETNDHFENKEMLLNLAETVVKTQDRIAIMHEIYVAQYESGKAEEGLELKFDKFLIKLRSAPNHKLNSSRLLEVSTFKKLTKLGEVIDACESYILASEEWIYKYAFVDEFNDRIVESLLKNYPHVEGDDEHQQVLTETRNFVRAYKEVLGSHENHTMEIDPYEHTEL